MFAAWKLTLAENVCQNTWNIISRHFFRVLEVLTNIFQQVNTFKWQKIFNISLKINSSRTNILSIKSKENSSNLGVVGNFWNCIIEFFANINHRLQIIILQKIIENLCKFAEFYRCLHKTRKKSQSLIRNWQNFL